MELATILLEDGEQIPCVLREMSVSGPESFTLSFPSCDLTCRVRRTLCRGDFVGVALLAESNPVGG